MKKNMKRICVYDIQKKNTDYKTKKKEEETE